MNEHVKIAKKNIPLRIIDGLVNLLTAEYVFRWMPNGGTAVMIRTIIVACQVYLPTIGLKSYSAPDTTLTFSMDQLIIEVHSTIPWFGAIFGGVYVALYSRFVSQFSYLANLYNRILEVATTDAIGNDENYNIWRAGFIEDALNMHLATKPTFASMIETMLNEKAVMTLLKEDEYLNQKELDWLCRMLGVEEEEEPEPQGKNIQRGHSDIFPFWFIPWSMQDTRPRD